MSNERTRKTAYKSETQDLPRIIFYINVRYREYLHIFDLRLMVLPLRVRHVPKTSSYLESPTVPNFAPFFIFSSNVPQQCLSMRAGSSRRRAATYEFRLSPNVGLKKIVLPKRKRNQRLTRIQASLTMGPSMVLDVTEACILTGYM